MQSFLCYLSLRKSPEFMTVSDLSQADNAPDLTPSAEYSAAL